jgi:hypothetical protein
MSSPALRVRDFPFTILTCGLLVVGGWISRTAAGQTITRRALRTFGSSPRDLRALDLGRVVTSAFVTDGGYVFWMALALTALFVGAAEHFAGTLAAALTFWCAHVATFAVSFLVTFPLRLAGSRLATLLYTTRDVGPSAGYVGCLGLALVCSRWRWRWLVLGVVGLALIAALALSLPEMHANPRDTSADLAHAVALGVGVIAGLLVERRRSAS